MVRRGIERSYRLFRTLPHNVAFGGDGFRGSCTGPCEPVVARVSSARPSNGPTLILFQLPESLADASSLLIVCGCFQLQANGEGGRRKKNGFTTPCEIHNTFSSTWGSSRRTFSLGITWFNFFMYKRSYI